MTKSLIVTHLNGPGMLCLCCLLNNRLHNHLEVQPPFFHLFYSIPFLFFITLSVMVKHLNYDVFEWVCYGVSLCLTTASTTTSNHHLPSLFLHAFLLLYRSLPGRNVLLWSMWIHLVWCLSLYLTTCTTTSDTNPLPFSILSIFLPLSLPLSWWNILLWTIWIWHGV